MALSAAEAAAGRAARDSSPEAARSTRSVTYQWVVHSRRPVVGAAGDSMATTSFPCAVSAAIRAMAGQFRRRQARRPLGERAPQTLLALVEMVAIWARMATSTL